MRCFCHGSLTQPTGVINCNPASPGLFNHLLPAAAPGPGRLRVLLCVLINRFHRASKSKVLCLNLIKSQI